MNKKIKIIFIVIIIIIFIILLYFQIKKYNNKKVNFNINNEIVTSNNNYDFEYDDLALENYNKKDLEKCELKELPKPKLISYYIEDKNIIIDRDNINFEKILVLNVKRANKPLSAMFTSYKLSDENIKKCMEYVYDDNPDNSVWFTIFESYDSNMQWLTFKNTNEYFQFNGSFNFDADIELTKELQNFLLSEDVIKSAE
jgi:hypothetical protein